jgi:glycosyltransferase involved in cell wall biosynthesis
MARIIAYTYYSTPWEMKSGDDVRIHTILSALGRSNTVVVFNLNSLINKYVKSFHDRVMYISLPRRFYVLLSKIIRWREHYDLNPLIKTTHYIDELILAVRLYKELRKAKVIMVFGSMSLFSFFSRLLGVKNTILYDPLANYAQTLYLRSRENPLGLLRYGLYLLLHRLEVRSADIVVYPSNVDLENAINMFKPKKTIIIPNPSPICYESIDEYRELRARRRDFDKPYFILLAGGRGKGNEEAVKVTIEVFNELPPEKFKLSITGPWQDMEKYVKNPSIELLGVVPKEKLKELLAISDYGLSPIFGHSSGTFLKILAYISAGLSIVSSPYGIIGVDIPKEIDVYLVKNKGEFLVTIKKLIYNVDTYGMLGKKRPISMCKESSLKIENILGKIENILGEKGL